MYFSFFVSVSAFFYVFKYKNKKFSFDYWGGGKRGVLPHLNYSFIHSFIHSGDLYSAYSRDYYSEALPAQSRTKKKDLRERCKIWKGGPSARNAAQTGDHSMLMDPQSKRPFAA